MGSHPGIRRLALSMAIASGLSAGACGATSTAPSVPLFPPPAPPSYVVHTLTGTVVERTASGVQPVSDVFVGGYAWNEDVLVPDALLTSTQSGPDGSYMLRGTAQVTWLGASKAGYGYFAAPYTLDRDATLTIELVPQP